MPVIDLNTGKPLGEEESAKLLTATALAPLGQKTVIDTETGELVPATPEVLPPFINSDEVVLMQKQLLSAQAMEQAASETSAGEAFLASTGRQFMRGIRTGKSIYASIFGDDELKKDLEKQRIAEEAAFAPLEKQHPVATMGGAITGAIGVAALPAGTAATATTKAVSFLAPRLAPLLGFAAAGAVEEMVIEGNPMMGAAFGLGGGLLLPVISRSFKQAYTNLTGKSAATFSDLPEELIIQMQNEGIDIKDLSAAAESILQQNYDAMLDPAAQVRQARAAEFGGAKLTSGQATKDFALQEAEDLAAKSGTDIGRKARNVLSEQQQAFISGAEESLIEPFGSTLTTDLSTKMDSFNKSEIGRIIRGSLEEVKTRDKKIVDGLYQTAREISGEGIPLNGVNLVETFFQFSDYSGITDAPRKATLNLLAKYGIIGKNPVTKGSMTTVDFDGQPLKFYTGKDGIIPLTVDNAESLRQAFVQLADSNPSEQAFKRAMIDSLDNSFGEAIEGIPVGTEKREAFEAARLAFSSWRDQFEVGDNITKILTYADMNKNIPVMTDEQVLSTFIRPTSQPSKGLGNLKRLKQALLSNPTESTRQAWSDVQMVGMEDFLKNSMVRTTDAAGNTTNVFSGNKLLTNLEKIGSEQATELWGEEVYKSLYNFATAVGDSQIKLTGATNPSESGTRIANMTRNMLSSLGDMVRTGGGFKAEAARAISKNKAEAQSLFELREGLASIKGERIPAVKVEQTVMQWIQSLPLATAQKVEKLGAAVQAPAIAGAAAGSEVIDRSKPDMTFNSGGTTFQGDVPGGAQ